MRKAEQGRTTGEADLVIEGGPECLRCLLLIEPHFDKLLQGVRVGLHHRGGPPWSSQGAQLGLCEGGVRSGVLPMLQQPLHGSLNGVALQEEGLARASLREAHGNQLLKSVLVRNLKRGGRGGELRELADKLETGSTSLKGLTKRKEGRDY